MNPTHSRTSKLAVLVFAVVLFTRCSGGSSPSSAGNNQAIISDDGGGLLSAPTSTPTPAAPFNPAPTNLPAVPDLGKTETSSDTTPVPQIGVSEDVTAPSPDNILQPPPCTGPTKAVVMLDNRLYTLVREELTTYVTAACNRRKFTIAIAPVQDLAEKDFASVKGIITAKRLEKPEIEGVLFIGNVRMPTFFMPRSDILTTRLFPRYFEDLDMVQGRTLTPGITLPTCGPSQGEPCAVSGFHGNNGSAIVPQHDVDTFSQGSSLGAEIWTAHMPVGYRDPAKNTWESYAAQLRPYLQKLPRYYQNSAAYNPAFYHVGNDLNFVQEILDVYWSTLGPSKIDYYAINSGGEAACKDNPACYTRVPLENYANPSAFMSYARSLPWIGEGWQNATTFLGHLSSGVRRVVWWNTHGNETWALISAAQAKSGIAPGKGAALAIISGCGVAGYVQPTSTAFQDTDVPADENLLLSLLYGNSAFVAATGSTHIRGNSALSHVILKDLQKTESYLGLAHRARIAAQDTDSSTPLRQRHEILFGDPFIDGQ